MCGVAGAFSYRPGAPPIDRDELLRVREAMRRRGPDGDGIWVSPDGCVGLAHRRLAIIDLSDAAAQPMVSADGRFRITFNGEIYNFRQLRRDLEGRGRAFRTGSDTEVLLHLYAERGEDMVHALRGMFAFAIWDEREARLFLARDPFGIKPLYYADDGSVFRFASQVKALRCGRVSDEPDPAGHVGFLVMGSVPEPFTMFRAISALPAGSTLTLARGGAARVARYFDVAREFASAGADAAPVPATARHEILAQALRDSVAHHMVADVPVGLFLSAGLDSTTVASLAREMAGSQLRSITLGAEEYRGTADDETLLAARVARGIDLQHDTTWITRPAFEEELDGVLRAMDQPSIDGVNTYFVSQAAARAGMKVALSGLGGDELLAGYPSFRDVPRIVRLFGPMRHAKALGRAMRRVCAPLLGRFMSPKYAGLAEYGGDLAGAYLLRRALYMPWEVERLLDPAFFHEGWSRLALLQALSATVAGTRDSRRAVAALETGWYMRNQLLRDADWAGMAHSLEIRVPLVDVELFRTVARLAAAGQPVSKRDAALAPATALPPEILARRKTGFSIPVHRWTQGIAAPLRRTRLLGEWALAVHRPYRKARFLALVTEAFGGHGGIALYNRDLLASVCAMPECGEVVALPRLAPLALEPMPAGLRYATHATGSKARFVKAALAALRHDGPFDAILCGHINLLWPALLARFWHRAPVVVFIYGVDAWSRQSWLRRRALRYVDRVVSISDITRRRFLSWSGLPEERCAILPNAIHRDWYGPGPRNPRLVERYGLEGRTVIMTLGRLVSSERYKGFDEVLEVLPDLAGEFPRLTYLIAGDGADRERLERKAVQLGIPERVRFTGHVAETEKADHYRLADAYVMPSRGEGFGFVLLEAMACGIPVVASRTDGGREAVRDGLLGTLVDPSSPKDVKEGIRAALRKGTGEVLPGLEVFEYRNFSARAAELVREAMAARPRRHAGPMRAAQSAAGPEASTP